MDPFFDRARFGRRSIAARKATRIQHARRIETLLERSGNRSTRAQIAKHIPTRFDGSRRGFAHVTTTRTAGDGFDVVEDRLHVSFARRCVEGETRVDELKAWIREQRSTAGPEVGQGRFESRGERRDD